MWKLAAFGGVVVVGISSVYSLDIGIYYETRCPASQRWIAQQLLDVAPFAEDLRLAKVSLHPVPHGNAKEVLTETGHYQYDCEHGPEECYLNRVEACGLSLIAEAQADMWAPWIDCVNKSFLDMENLKRAEVHLVKAIAANQLAMAEARRSAIAARDAAKAAANGQIGEAGRDAAAAAVAAAKAAADASLAAMEVTRAAAAAAAGGDRFWALCPIGVTNARMVLLEVLACSLSPLGEKMQHLMAEQTPAHDYVPWVTIDRHHSLLAEKDLRCAICVSPAGQEPSLRELCKGKANCDKTETGSSKQQTPVVAIFRDSGFYPGVATEEA